MLMGFPSGSVVKTRPAKQEIQIQLLGWEDTPAKGNGNPLCIIAWRIPWTEEPGGLQLMGLQRAGHNLATTQQQQTLCL